MPVFETLIIVIALLVIAIFLASRSTHLIGPTEVGLVTKRFARRKLSSGDPIAFRGEAGYQAELLMPGSRFRPWPIYIVSKHPWVQVPAGEIGVVIAQAGQPLPIGAKSAISNPAFGDYADLQSFLADAPRRVHGAHGERRVRRARVAGAAGHRRPAPGPALA
jgi:hypothetical protein